VSGLRSPPKEILLANALVVCVAVYATCLFYFFENSYFRVVQEDQALEWATFWSFLIASVWFFRGAINQVADQRSVVAGGWFYIGLACFCFFVAFEEISWGQRLFGISPPEYFLAENYQQEMNFHNLMSTSLRRASLYLILLGYGVILPLLATQKALGRVLARLRVVVVPLGLVPAFAATAMLVFLQPFRFSTEFAELMMGLCFLFLAVTPPGASGAGWEPKAYLSAWLACLVLGVVSTPLARALADDDANKILAANLELKALREDFVSGRATAKCGQHQRLYTLVSKRGQRNLLSGSFAGLVSQGLPEERAAYFLDPWNYAYWVRVICAGSNEPVTFLYSFGPNMRRDAMSDKDLGDDILVYVRE